MTAEHDEEAELFTDAVMRAGRAWAGASRLATPGTVKAKEAKLARAAMLAMQAFMLSLGEELAASRQLKPRPSQAKDAATEEPARPEAGGGHPMRPHPVRRALEHVCEAVPALLALLAVPNRLTAAQRGYALRAVETVASLMEAITVAGE